MPSVVCKRRNRIDVLTLELEPLPARHEDRRTRGVAQACDFRRDLGQEVLDVVDEEQRTLAGECATTSSARSRSARSSTMSTCASG